jgi:hypothetical protein
MFLPECDQSSVAPAENIALGFFDVRDAPGMSEAREIALSISGVLPEVPAAPGIGVARFEMIIGDP